MGLDFWSLVGFVCTDILGIAMAFGILALLFFILLQRRLRGMACLVCAYTNTCRSNPAFSEGGGKDLFQF
jgi:hypothetical protein